MARAQWVGRSCRVQIVETYFLARTDCNYSPYTHHEDLEFCHWDRDTPEELREPEEAAPIARGAFREHDHWAVSTAPDVL